MTQRYQNDEFSLTDIWTIIKCNKRIILISPIFFGIAAFFFVTFFVTPTWESSAILQVGQVGQVAQTPKLVEPIPNVVSRMMQPSFATKMLEQSKLVDGELITLKGIYGNSLKVTKIKDAELIEFKVRGYSPMMAQSLAENTLSYLQKIHGEMMKASITRIESQIQTTNEDISTVKKEIEFLTQQLQGNHNWNSYNATLAATVLQDKSTQLRTLTQAKLLLAEQLSPSVTFPTKIIGEFSVSDDPVAPKKSLIVSLAVLLGLFVGVCVAFVLNLINKTKV